MLFVLQIQGLLQSCPGQFFLQGQHDTHNFGGDFRGNFGGDFPGDFGGHRPGQRMAGQPDHKRERAIRIAESKGYANTDKLEQIAGHIWEARNAAEDLRAKAEMAEYAEANPEASLDQQQGDEEYAPDANFDGFLTIISEKCMVPKDEISLLSHFVDDLGADDMEMAEIVMAVEETFEIEIPDDHAEPETVEMLWNTVQSLVPA